MLKNRLNPVRSNQETTGTMNQQQLKNCFDIGESSKSSLKQSTRIKLGNVIRCQVKMPHGVYDNFCLKKGAKVKDLFRQVSGSLRIWEIDYFGLKLKSDEMNIITWMNPNEWLLKYCSKKSIKTDFDIICSFCIKFYLSDPNIIEDDNTRFIYFSQIFHDINSRVIEVPKNLEQRLFGLVLQSQVGDYTPELEVPDYASKYAFLPNQTREVEKLAISYHQQLIGVQTHQAEGEFLTIIKGLNGYGFQTFSVYNEMMVSIKFNITPSGIILTSKGINVTFLQWENIKKILQHKKAIKIYFYTNSHFLTSKQFSLKESNEAKSLYCFVKSYFKFFCSRYLPQKTIKRTPIFGLTRSKSFVVDENVKYLDKSSTMNMQWENMSFRKSFDGSYFNSNVSLNLPPFNHTIDQQLNSTQKEKYTVNLDNLKRGLESLKLRKNFDNSKISRSNSILKENSFNATQKQPKTSSRSQKSVTIKLERTTSLVSLGSFSYHKQN